MSAVIDQEVVFPGVTAAELFSIYTTSEKHSAAIQGEAEASSVEGAPFFAFGRGGLHGRNLLVTPQRMIVQSWRANNFSEEDPDSVLILNFIDQPDGGAIRLSHANVPERLRDHTAEAWGQMYWRRWQDHLRR